MAKLDADTSKHIDDLVAFFNKSERNAELLQIFATFMSVARTKGGPEVFGKRLREARRQAKRDAA